MRSIKLTPKTKAFVQFTALGLAGALATACSKHTAGGPDQSTFLVTPVIARSVQTAATDPAYNLPSSKVFQVKACVQDMGLLKPVIGLSFHVKGVNQSQTELAVRSDADGCLYWNDSVQFNYLGKEQYIPMERTITADAPHRGEVTLHLAVDPWKDSSDSLVDLRYGSVQALAMADQSQGSQSKLFVQDLGVHLFNQQFSGNSLTVQAQLNLRPQFQRQGDGGLLKLESLSQGSLQLDLYLIEKTRVSQEKSLQQSFILAKQTLDVQVLNGLGETNTSLTLGHVPSPYSQFEIAFRLSPRQSPDFQADEGTVALDALITQGRYSKVSLPSYQRLDTYVSQLSPGQVLAAAKSTSKPSTSAPSGAKALQFAEVRVEFGGIEKPSHPDSNLSQFGTQITACLVGALDQKPIYNFPFEAAVCGQTGADTSCEKGFHSLTTDPSGCLHWQERFRYDYFAKEQWIPKTVTVRSVTLPYQNETSTYTVYINPWQRGGLFQWDSRNGEPPAIAEKSVGTKTSTGPKRPAASSKIEIRSLNYNFTGRDFTIDRNMNLIVHRQYQLSFNPVVKRSDSPSDGITYEALYPGRYQLKALLMTAPDSGRAMVAMPLAFYTSQVEVSNGNATAKIELPISLAEMPLFSARTRLILELSDQSAASSLRPALIEAPFQGMDSAGSYAASEALGGEEQILGALASGDDAITTLTAQGKSLAFVSQRKFNADRTLRELTGMRRIDPVRKMSDFCSQLFADSTIKTVACITAPNHSMQIIHFAEIEQITSLPEEISSDMTALSISASISHSDSHDVSTSKSISASTSVSAGIDAKLGLDIFGTGAKTGVGWNNSMSWGVSHSWDHSRSDSHSVTESESKTMSLESHTFRFTAKARHCVAAKNDDLQGVYSCENQLRSESFEETWAYLSQNRPGLTVMGDSGSAWDQGLTKMVRGRENLDQLRKTLADRTKSLVIERDDSLIPASQRVSQALGGLSGIVPILADDSIPGTVILAQ